MKRKGTKGAFGKATTKKIAAGKKEGGIEEKRAVFAENMKKIAAKHKGGGKTAERRTQHAGKGGRRQAMGHDAIGSHDGYTMSAKKKK